MGLDQHDILDLLENVSHEASLDLLGIADVRQAGRELLEIPAHVREELLLAIVIAVRVSPCVLDTLVDGPNLLYYHHYRQLNFRLDRGAAKVAQEIERIGYTALAIPASQIVDWTTMRGHVSHKEMAYLAGLGWQGRNNLLVTRQWGAQVRLATVLTNLPLDPAQPATADCGSCRRCLSACPAGAIGEEPGDFDCEACYQQLKQFSKERRIGHHICGLCVKACQTPVGRH